MKMQGFYVIGFITGAMILAISEGVPDKQLACVLIWVIVGFSMLLSMLIDSKIETENADATRELNKQIAWALFKGNYPLSEEQWKILDLTDEFKQAHGYNADGTLKQK